MRTLIIILAATLLIPAAALCQDASQAFVEAVYQETATGDMAKAASLYKQVIEESGDASLVARATLRLGNCRRKLGDTDSAREAYRTVVDKYPSQTEAVKQAKLALLSLGPDEDELKKWSESLKDEIDQLRGTLDEVNKQISGLKKKISGATEDEKAARIFDEMVIREETRKGVSRYLASHYFRTGLTAYKSLDYKRALGDFRAAANLDSDNRLIQGYLEKTEFILGSRTSLTPDAMNGAPDDPSASLVEKIKAAYEIATSSANEGNHRMALAALEELFDRVRWTDSMLVPDEAKEILEKADTLAEECLIRLYPAESRNIKMLNEERKNLALKLKEKLDEILAARIQNAGSANEVRKKAKELADSGSLPEAKELLESHIASWGESAQIRELLDEINQAIRSGERTNGGNEHFEILVAAFALPSEELNMLKIPFKALKPSGDKGVPLVFASLGAEKGKEILSVAALAGTDALGRFSDIKTASGEKGSGFLGSSMSYVSGYRRLAGSEKEEYEPVKDIVFQGIKLSLTPANKDGKITLETDITVSVVQDEPRVVRTKEGEIEIPRLFQVSLKHSFALEPGQYIVVGSLPNTLVPGTDRDKDGMYLLISPKPVKETSEPPSEK